jgi:putative phosphoesterase
MKISIMSDSHDRWEILEKAIEISNENNCEYLLFAGDLIAPSGLAILEKFNGNVKFVWGNNEGEKVGLTRKMDASEKIQLAGDIYEDEIDGIKIFMNHYPKIVELASKSGDYDLCVYGHDHTYHHSKVRDTVLVNPGAISPYKIEGSTFVIFDTETKEVERVDL